MQSLPASPPKHPAPFSGKRSHNVSCFANIRGTAAVSQDNAGLGSKRFALDCNPLGFHDHPKDDMVRSVFRV